MTRRSLEQWLAWQETLHAKSVDLGLQRVETVLVRLGADKPPFTILTVAGTNGKGSSVAMLESILGTAGYRVGAYTSPHLLRYNERVRVGGEEVSDEELCQAFARIDSARSSVSLTYFEFATLAALDIFCWRGVEIAVLEVGLGGRMDAVNSLDADVALVTTVDVDHVAWLGPNRESIGYEKAGIFREGRPAVVGDPLPPRRLVAHAEAIGAPLYVQGDAFHYTVDVASWRWYCEDSQRFGIPHPALRGRSQIQNAAAVLMVLNLIRSRFPVGQDDIRRGLLNVRLPGRFQLLSTPVPTILDVAHNEQSARTLKQNLDEHQCKGRTFALIGMLAEKDINGVVCALDPAVDEWHGAGLAVERGANAVYMASQLSNVALRGTVEIHQNVRQAYQAIREVATADDRIVVFGSFYTVAALLEMGIIGDST